MGNKAEIHLEIGSGFFRIVAEDAIYNITVLGRASGPSPGPENIPKAGNSAPSSADPAPADGEGEGYYKQVSTDLYKDIGYLARKLSATIMDLPMEDRRLKRVDLDEAGEKIEDAKSQLKDIVDMTESATMEIMDCVEDIQGQTRDVHELLSALKDHKAFQQLPEESGEEAEGGEAVSPTTAIRDQLARAREIVARLQEVNPGEAATTSPHQDKEPRHLFSLDTIFQTLYEFCTNETVKGHLSSLREQAEEVFDHEVLLDRLNTLAASIEPDEDHFLQFQLADLLGVLAQACGDDKFENLFKRMAASQETIFLDQKLPLEVPPLEEVAKPADGETAVAAGDPQIEELDGLLAGSMEHLDRLPAEAGAASPGMSTMSMADQTEIFNKIEMAFSIVSTISGDVQKITEALSFQDLSGQQIMKIIKLLSDFQVQLLAIVVSFGSQLKHKERNANITVEESKRLAQEDVDAYINKIGGQEEKGEPVLNQDAVNQMLEEMGF